MGLQNHFSQIYTSHHGSRQGELYGAGDGRPSNQPIEPILSIEGQEYAGWDGQHVHSKKILHYYIDNLAKSLQRGLIKLPQWHHKSQNGHKIASLHYHVLDLHIAAHQMGYGVSQQDDADTDQNVEEYD